MGVITTFGTLQTAVSAYLGRTLPSQAPYDMVTSDINASFRLKIMESTTTLTAAEEIDLSSLSPAFLAVESVYRDSTPQFALEVTSSAVIRNEFDSASVPSKFAIINDKMLLNGAGGADSIEMNYFGKIADFSVSGDTNAILTTYPKIFLFGALYYHGALNGDPRASVWEGEYNKAIAQTIATDQASRFSGSPLVPSVATAP